MWIRDNDDRSFHTQSWHLVQSRGQQVELLAQLKLAPCDRRLVQFAFLLPTEAKPPSMRTLQTLDTSGQ